MVIRYSTVLNYLSDCILVRPHAHRYFRNFLQNSISETAKMSSQMWSVFCSKWGHVDERVHSTLLTTGVQSGEKHRYVSNTGIYCVDEQLHSAEQSICLPSAPFTEPRSYVMKLTEPQAILAIWQGSRGAGLLELKIAVGLNNISGMCLPCAAR